MIPRRAAHRLAVVALLAIGTGAAHAQATHRAAPAATVRDTLPPRCPPIAPVAPVSPARRRAARALAARAQAAAITADDTTARALYRRAVATDPGDPSTLYALARADEAARDPRAIGEYCRFLALAPDAAEAADARQRIASLALAFPIPSAPPAPPAPPSPGSALALGILFPGGGQYATHRVPQGLLATVATTGALVYAFQTRTTTTSVTRTAVDPNGKPYQYQDVTTHTLRPNLSAGVGTAGALWLISAIEAYTHARSAVAAMRSRGPGGPHAARAALGPAVVPLDGATGVGVRIAIR